MTVIFDTATEATTTAITPITWTHTVTGGITDAFVLIWVAIRNSGQNITGATWNGRNMTLIDTESIAAQATKIACFGIAVTEGEVGSPQTISASFTSNPQCYAISQSYGNVDPSWTPGERGTNWNGSASGSVGNPSVTLNVSDIDMMGSGFFMQNDRTVTFNGTTDVNDHGATPTGHTIAAGHLAAGADTASWTCLAENNAMIAVMLTSLTEYVPGIDVMIGT